MGEVTCAHIVEGMSGKGRVYVHACGVGVGTCRLQAHAHFFFFFFFFFRPKGARSRGAERTVQGTERSEV